MQCPACGNTLSQMTAGDIAVDVCRGGCGGIWFDQLELRKVDDADEAVGEALLDTEQKPGSEIAQTDQRTCPRCGDVVMMRHYYSPKREVEVDECGQCGGFWLDTGELATLRGQYAGADERRDEYHASAKAVFRKQLSELRDEVDSQDAVFGQVDRIHRFLFRSRE